MATDAPPFKPLKIELVKQALVIGFGAGKARGICRPAAVFNAKGAAVARAVCRRDLRNAVTSRPPLPDPSDVTESLPGTWLFGGMLYAHFGHFLCESTARLWALDAADEKIDGVLFYPKKQVTWQNRFLDPVLPWLQIAGVTVPVRLAQAPIRVERLLVPDQGFGMWDMIAGAPEYRAYVAARFGASVAAKGAARIYISRSRLYSKRGRILGEERLESLLAAEGYSIFHPQDHPIEDQIAQYKTAEQIVSNDCSALHLAAFFARPATRLAILTRRPGDTIDNFTNQYRAFAGVEPLVVGPILQLHAFEGAKNGFMGEVYSELDFPVIQRELAAGGFVTRGAVWASPDPSDIRAELDRLGKRLGRRIDPLDGVAA